MITSVSQQYFHYEGGEMSDATLDSVIVAEYPLYGVPADQIVADPNLAAKFLDRVNLQLPSELRVDQATFNKRLLNRRRRPSERRFAALTAGF